MGIDGLMMNPASIIESKRDGGRLTAEEIDAFIRGYTAGRVTEYQMAALAMAIYFQGMDAEETAALTTSMHASGGRLSRRAATPPRVDKHSTGGVGDKVSLVLAPLLACCDVHVPMISGRGLGVTGGTLDKLEAIPGFRTDLSAEEIETALAETGCVITGQTEDLVPADKKLYALRDVTGTVPSLPLITASILSKKLAEDLDALVLDVKWGSGSFMKTRVEAERLADLLRSTGESLGLGTSYVLTDMNQPLGRLCGNAVEVREALDVLEGRGPADVVDLVLALGGKLLVRVGRAATAEEAATVLADRLETGAARERFAWMVHAQGGDLDAPLPIADAHDVPSTGSGIVTRIDTAAIGRAIITLGGGRSVATDTIDHSVGVEMLVRLGDSVDPGQVAARIFAGATGRDEAMALVRAAIEIGA